MSVTDYYIIFRPKPSNPYVKQIERFRESYSFTGVLFQNIHAYVPVKITVETLKLETDTERKRFVNFIGVRVKNCMINTLASMFRYFNRVSDTLDLVGNANLELENKEKAYITLTPTEFFDEYLSTLVSNLITETRDWGKEYGYRVGVERTGREGLRYEHVKTFNKKYFLQYMQRILDMESPFEVSARKWDFIFKDKLNIYWTHGWEDFVSSAVSVYTNIPSSSSSSQTIGNSKPGSPGST